MVHPLRIKTIALEKCFFFYDSLFFLLKSNGSRHSFNTNMLSIYSKPSGFKIAPMPGRQEGLVTGKLVVASSDGEVS